MFTKEANGLLHFLVSHFFYLPLMNSRITSNHCLLLLYLYCVGLPGPWRMMILAEKEQVPEEDDLPSHWPTP